MKLRYLACSRRSSRLMAVVPSAIAEEGRLPSRPRDTMLCLKTGGWTEITGTDARTTLITGPRARTRSSVTAATTAIFAGSGGDEIDGGDGRDTIDAGRGNDVDLLARRRLRDTIDCGSGRDTYVADTVDARRTARRSPAEDEGSADARLELQRAGAERAGDAAQVQRQLRAARRSRGDRRTGGR